MYESYLDSLIKEKEFFFKDNQKCVNTDWIFDDDIKELLFWVVVSF